MKNVYLFFRYRIYKRNKNQQRGIRFDNKDNILMSTFYKFYII